MPKLKIATCQFPVGTDPARNAHRIKRMIRAAAGKGAQVAHFPEIALSGFGGKPSPRGVLRREAAAIMDCAGACSIWVIVGSLHPLTGKRLPHNCLYVVDAEGRLADRYDKLFVTRGELAQCTPGNYFCVVEIEGVRCGFLICHDFRYPELYRVYKKMGVQCVFHSFHNAGKSGPTLHSAITKPTLQAHAAFNHVWISASNASNPYQSWSSCVIQPDGRIRESLRRHRSGMLIHVIDTDESFEDKCGSRNRAMEGVFHSGETVKDKRSEERNCL